MCLTFVVFLSVVATNVSGMDHTDKPAESGARSDALLEQLAVAEAERVRAEARAAALIVDIDQARTSEAASHVDPRIQALEAVSAAVDIGLRVGLSTGAVTCRLVGYNLVRTHMPAL